MPQNTSTNKVEYITNKVHVALNETMGIIEFDNVIRMVIGFIVLRRIDCLIGRKSELMASAYEYHRMTDDIDEYLQSVSGHVFFNYSGLNFAKLVERPDKITFYMDSYLKGFNKSVLALLAKLEFARVIARLNEKELLYRIVNIFADLDLSVNVLPSDITGVISNAISLRDNYESPELFCKYAAELLYDKNIIEDNIKIYDPVCGKGTLARTVADELLIQYNKRPEIYGQDINELSVGIASACSLIMGCSPENIQLGNTLLEDAFDGETYQYVVADLPLAMPWSFYYKELTNDQSGRYSYGMPSEKDSQLLFIEHILSKMDSNGSRAIVFTNARPLCSDDKGDDKVRNKILCDDLLETVISLPNTAKFNNRYVLIFNNKKTEYQKGRVHLIDGTTLRNSYSDQITDEQSLLNAICACYESDSNSDSHKYVDNMDFGSYLIYVRDKKNKKVYTVETPMVNDPHYFIEQKGLLPSEDNSYEILYDKTEAIYRIDFDKLFVKEGKTVSSTESLSKVKEALESAMFLSSRLNSLSELKPCRYPVPVNEGLYKNAPSHWNRFFLRDFVELKNGKNYKELSDSSDGTPIVSVASLRDSSLSIIEYTNDPKLVKVQEDDIVLVNTGSKSGDILYGREGALGSSMALIKPNEEMISKWYLYYLMIAHTEFFNSQATGNSIKRLKENTVLGQVVYLPPMEEQKRIEEFIDNIVSGFNNMYDAFGTAIPVFEEYLNALIYELITGKYEL